MRKEQIITTNNTQMEEKGMKNRFTVYGIRDLGTELSPITMLVMMESIQNMIVENGKRGKATWLYIDEFHVLLNSEYQRHSFDS